MADTQLILNEIKQMKEQLAEIVKAMPKRKAPRRFKPPKRDDVHKYAKERGREDMADRFYDYYEASEWHDKDGKEVKNWKGRFISWEGRNTKPQHTDTRSIWE